MRESSVNLLLASLVEWHIKSNDSGFPPVGIMHRIAHEGPAAGGSRKASHKILCADMSTDLRRTQSAFNALDYDLRLVAVVKHSPVPIVNGKPRYKFWGDREKAHYLGQKLTTFKGRYRKVLRHISRSPVWRK